MAGRMCSGKFDFKVESFAEVSLDVLVLSFLIEEFYFI